MSSSTDSSTSQRVLRGDSCAQASQLRIPELRTGAWTRFGDSATQGDEVTEQLLDRLAESTRSAARAQGYAVGWAQGRGEAEVAARAEADEAARRDAALAQQRAVEHEAAVTALRAAAARLDDELVAVCRSVDEQAARLALELTRELVGHAPADADHVVARVVGLLPDHPIVRVRLHPEVATNAGRLREHGITVVADPELGRGDAVVEADDHVVDLRVEQALARLAEVLS